MSIESMVTVLNAGNLTPRRKLILLGIANHDGDGGSWPSISTLARYAVCSDRTVQRELQKLTQEGFVTIEMQFLPDITLLCEDCGGKRFKKPVLQVKYNQKNIFEVLNLTISEAVKFFQKEPKIVARLEILERVGLGYLRLGQSSDTLSGGEAQRVKLAFFLTQAKERKGTLYIFDEPTTGLHFDDVRKLLAAMQALVEQGNSVLIVEHNVEVMKCADWIVDLGPEGGDLGGGLVYQGSPEGLLSVQESATSPFLVGKL